MKKIFVARAMSTLFFFQLYGVVLGIEKETQGLPKHKGIHRFVQRLRRGRTVQEQLPTVADIGRERTISMQQASDAQSSQFKSLESVGPEVSTDTASQLQHFFARGQCRPAPEEGSKRARTISMQVVAEPSVEDWMSTENGSSGRDRAQSRMFAIRRSRPAHVARQGVQLFDKTATVFLDEGGRWSRKEQKKQRDRTQRFAGAAARGDWDAIRRQLDEGMNPNALDISDTPALVHAAYAGARNIVVDLLARGANPVSQDAEGKTALMVAAEYGNKRIIEDLISAIARPHRQPDMLFDDAAIRGVLNRTDTNNKTALTYARENGYTEIAELLERWGAK